MHSCNQNAQTSLPRSRPRLRACGTLWLNRHSCSVWLRRLLPVVLAGLGVCLCLRLFRGQDWSLVALNLRRAGPWVAVLLSMPMVSNFVHMLGWRSLIERSWRPRLGRAFCIFVAAQAGNEIGSSILGESIKVAAFPQPAQKAALRAVIWDNLTSLVALGVVLLTVSALPLRAELHLTVWRIGLLVLALLLVTVLGLALARRLQATDRPPLGAITLAFLAHYLGKLWIVAEYAIALALVANATWHNSALLGFASLLGTSVGAPVPGQIGVVEAALVSCAGFAQLTMPTLLSIAILRRARSLTWIVVGATLGVAVGVTATRKTKSGAC